jgi:cobalt-zinc-cadmium efflux system protein
LHNEHGHRHPGAETRHRSQRILLIALAVTAGFAAVEAAGGALTGSLALLADAGHMLTDVLALSLSLFAAWVAGRPSTPRKTYGYYRAEILAALVNGALLLGAAALLAREAAGRLSSPEHVHAPAMLLVAVAGLLVNLAVGLLLLRWGGNSLNMRGALAHVAGDALGSVGAIAAGLVILATGWQQADPAASLLIVALIIFGAWRLLREAVDVLLEGTPAHIDMSELEHAMTAVPGVARVHDVHVWTVTSGFVAMSGHAELDGTRDSHTVLDRLTETLNRQFSIAHVTIQPEPADHAADCVELVCEPVEPRVARR